MEIWIVVIYLTLVLAFIKTSSEMKIDMTNEEIKIAPGVLKQPVVLEECSEESENCDDYDDVIDYQDAYKYRRPKSKKCGCVRKLPTSTARITYICPTCPTCPPCIQFPPPTCPPCIQLPPPPCPPCPKYTCKSEEEEIEIDFG